MADPLVAAVRRKRNGREGTLRRLELRIVLDRGAEFLFRRLAVRWEIGGAVVRGRTALIARYESATATQRAFVLAALRAHAAEHYPELEAP